MQHTNDKQTADISKSFCVGHATASYIHVCGRRNPQLDQCIIQSVNDLAEILRIGAPGLDIPPSEPFIVDKVTLSDSPSFKAYGTNIKIYGLPTYHINNLHIDLQKRQLDIDLNFGEVKLIANYKISGRILIPIEEEGPITLISKDVGAKVRLNYELIERKGKTYMYFSSMTTKLDIKDFSAKFETQIFEKTIQEAITQALDNSHKEIIETSGPSIENSISQRCLEIGNKLCRKFSYEELFPDRE